ncbi:MAG: hypothetical protein WAO00_12540 [Chthoniobacterales bacterium]
MIPAKREPWLDSILFRLNSAVALLILFLLLGGCAAVALMSSIAVMGKGSPLFSFVAVAAAVAVVPVIRSLSRMTGQEPTKGTLFMGCSLGLLGMLFGFLCGPGLARVVLAGSGAMAFLGAGYFFVRSKRSQ